MHSVTERSDSASAQYGMDVAAAMGRRSHDALCELHRIREQFVKTATSVSRASVIAAAAAAVALLMTPGMASASTASVQADPFNAQITRTAVSSALATSPSDAALAKASNAQLVKLGVRCVPIDGLTYCLHRGWEGTAAQATSDVNAAVKSASAMTATALTSANRGGDMSLVSYLKHWAGMSRAQRVAQETTELNEAVKAAGKQVYYNDVVLNQKPLPANFATAFPDLASWVPASRTMLAREKQLTVEHNIADGVTPNINPVDPPVANNYITMSTAKMKKQEKGNWCGPTSLQAFVWNSPTGGVYQTQTYEAGKLGVTAAGTSTYIGDLKDEINSQTTWDSSSYAGSYAVVSISSYTLDQWENLFMNHLAIEHSPIQLHPKLAPGNNDYYPGSTSGHFDVGRGYNMDYPGNGGPTKDIVDLFEPAGGAAEGNVYTSLTATDTFEDIGKANRNNSGQEDIAF